MSYKHLRSRLKGSQGNSFESMVNAFEAEGEENRHTFIPKVLQPISDYSKEIEEIRAIDAKLGYTFERLNVHQRHAVFHPTPNAILSAMVGSGKTTVLIAKIFYLHFVKKVALENIIVLTFTNKAAREIKERLANFLGDQYTDTKEQLRYVGTFHSVARQLLQEHPQLTTLGYRPEFTIMDEQEKAEFLQRLIIQNELNIKYQNKLSKRWKNFIANGELRMGNMKQEDDLAQLIKLAEAEKANINAMTFDDLIAQCNQLLESSNPFTPQWIIVDEFQDCNEEQLEFIDNLKQETTNLFVVGDQNQSIYAWRGSKEDVFEETYQKWQATWMELPQNYRTTGHILSAAEALLQDNKASLIATRQDGTPIELVQHFDDQQEAYYLSAQLELLQKAEVDLDNIAILFRTHQQIPLVQTILAQANIPHQLVKRIELHDNVAQHFLLRILKLSLNANDVDAVLAVVTDKTFGAIKRTKTLLKHIQNRDKQSTALQAVVNFLAAHKTTHPLHIKLLAQIEKLKVDFINTATTDATNFIDFLGLTPILKPTSIHHKEYINSISDAWEQLIFFIQKQTWGLQSELLHIAIDQVVLESTFFINDRIKEQGNGVHLMTIHASKGLEFERIYIAGANTGIIPLTQHQKGNENIKEEKRLLFVAITRGKNDVEIGWYTQPTTRNTNPSPSYFLNSVPDHLLNRKTSANSSTEEQPKPTINTKWTVGVDIKHKKYGSGSITSISKKEIICNFEGVGEKSFSKAFAKALLTVEE